MNKKCTRKNKTQNISENIQRLNENNQSSNWFKRTLKRIFTVQTLSLVVACISTTIAWVQCQDSKNSLRLLEYEKLTENRIRFHDDLILRLGGYKLQNGETYNVDIIRNPPSGCGPFTFKIELMNDGKLDAKNIRVIFSGKFENAIYKFKRFNESFSNKEGGGEVQIDYLHPKELCEVAICYIVPDTIQGLKDNSRFICSCEDKANPFVVYFNMNIFNFDNINEYKTYLSSKYGTKDKYEQHWVGDNNFIVHCNTKLVGINEFRDELMIYKVVRENGVLRLQYTSNKDI